MISDSVRCSACEWPLPPELWNTDARTACPNCGRHIHVKVFPALVRARSVGMAERLGGDAEASCFYHAGNRAVRPCDDCGRFLCSLCEIEIPGKVLCPVCFDASLQGRKIQQMEESRTMHDSIALSLAILPLIVWPTIVFTAPLSLYWIIRHWKSPRSVVPRTRIRFYAAGFFAICEIALVTLLIAVIWTRRR